jgi:glyoxylase-like metal-dependent hydrolase (beta-lactamase superfamily II)
MSMHYFFDISTATFTYIVTDEPTNKCAIIDSVLGYDMYAGRTSTSSMERVITFVEKNNLTVEWILETHAHADHLSAAYFLQKKLGGKIGIGEHIKEVLQFWVPIFNTQKNTPLDGSQFDRLFKDGDIFSIGSTQVRVMNTPGHTPACVSYLIEDAVFVGDTIFMPYVGTARTDFPGGSAEKLYDSIQKILSLPKHVRIYPCHDYPPEGVEPGNLSTVAEQKESNVMIHDGVNMQEFVLARNVRDEGKEVPKLLLPSIQVNLRVGDLGTPEHNGIKYIKIPLNKF